MRAEELMIGDWVSLSEIDIIPCKVVELHADELLVIQSQDTACDIVGYDMIHPIPLTAEILAKNGFRYEHNYGQFYRSILGDYAKDKEPTVNIGWNSRNEMCEWDIADGHRGASYGHNPLFVHELQHALKGCELWDLADNFKVEE